MAQTPISGSSSYCTPADSLNFVDVRRVGQYVSDTGKTVPPQDLLSNTVWLAYLQASSGEVEAECFAGGRYTADDLANLSSAAQRAANPPVVSNGEWLLRKLVAKNAYGDLVRDRRGMVKEGDADLAGIVWAREMMSKLRAGKTIFGFQEAADAERTEADFMDQGDFQTLGLSSDQARPFFGNRAKNRRPLSGR